MDEAEEAGMLAAAFRLMRELRDNVVAEVSGPLKETHTRWDAISVDFWGRSLRSENDNDHIGGVYLPLIFSPRVVDLLAETIRARLEELGVVVE